MKALFLLFVLVAVANAYTANWMSRLGMSDKYYPQLKLPATHNSGTYGLSDSFSVDTSLDPSMMIMPQLYGMFGMYGINPGLVKEVMKPWMSCQRRTIYGQLMDGIRHFDFRVCQQGLEYYVCHGFIGPNYKDIFEQIRFYLSVFPDEFISLDFNHVYGVTNHTEFSGFVQRSLPGLIIPKGNINTVLGSLSGRVFVFYEAAQDIFDRSGSITTYWANKQTMPDLTSAIVSHQNARSDLSKLYVSQFLMTPTLNTIATGLVKDDNTSIEDFAENYYWRIPMIIEMQFNKTLMNIVNTDYYSRHFVSVIIGSN